MLSECPPDFTPQRHKNNRPKPNLKKGTNTNSNPTIKKSGVRFDLAEHVVTFNKIENASY